MKKLRIIFTVIAAIFVALVVPIGALVSWSWAAICAVGALLFFGLMLLSKQKQEESDKRARYDELPQINSASSDSEKTNQDK